MTVLSWLRASCDRANRRLEPGRIPIAVPGPGPAKSHVIGVMLAQHTAMVAEDIAEAIEAAAPGHSHTEEYGQLETCSVCARHRQALADAALARRIGGKQ